MRFIIPTLAIAGAATALPSQQARAATTTSTSKGFNLIAHVTDPTRDLTPSVEGQVVGAAHTGAGFNAAVFYDTTGRLFYQNGTAEQVANRETTIVTDGGTPPFSFTLQVQPAGEARRILDISIGQGTANAVVAADGGAQLVNGLGEGTWLACNEVIPYYNRAFLTLQYAYGAGAETPEGCAPIELVAKCAALNDLPDGSLSSHEFATEVACSE